MKITNVKIEMTIDGIRYAKGVSEVTKPRDLISLFKVCVRTIEMKANPSCRTPIP